MKAVLFALLVASLVLHPGATLQCYSCKAQVSGQDCLHVQNCSQDETQCRTERIRAAGLLTVLSKGCSARCVPDSQNYYVGEKNVTCCFTDLCNVNGARAPQPATATLGLLSVLGGLLLRGSCPL
ncbi:prostate stem cell antigen [Tupaia chinensis]|nr:prostate stem cell antigen [Tupaia chinensis]